MVSQARIILGLPKSLPMVPSPSLLPVISCCFPGFRFAEAGQGSLPHLHEELQVTPAHYQSSRAPQYPGPGPKEETQEQPATLPCRTAGAPCSLSQQERQQRCKAARRTTTGPVLRVSKGHLGAKLLLFRAGLGVSPLAVSILTLCQVNLHSYEELQAALAHYQSSRAHQCTGRKEEGQRAGSRTFMKNCRWPLRE